MASVLPRTLPRETYPAPQCYVCLQLIPYVYGYHEGDPYYKEPGDLSAYTGIRSPEDLRKTRFATDSTLWATFFRAVIRRDNSDPSQSRISGVRRATFFGEYEGEFGTYYHDYTTCVPTDPNALSMDPPSAPGHHLLRRHTFRLWKYVLRASFWQLLFHERCWCLLLKVLGETRVQDHFDLLLEAFDDWVAAVRVYRSNYPPPRANCMDRLTMLSSLDPDPWHIDRLEPVIADANRTQPDLPVQPSGPSLPPELLMMVLDYLLGEPRDHDLESTIRDLQNVSQVLGWRVPDRYWRPRLRKVLLCTDEDLQPADLDWGQVYLGVLRAMYQDPPGSRVPRGPIQARTDRIGVLQCIKYFFDRKLDGTLGMGQLSLGPG